MGAGGSSHAILNSWVSGGGISGIRVRNVLPRLDFHLPDAYLSAQGGADDPYVSRVTRYHG